MWTDDCDPGTLRNNILELEQLVDQLIDERDAIRCAFEIAVNDMRRLEGKANEFKRSTRERLDSVRATKR